MDSGFEDVSESLESKFGDTEMIDTANIDYYRENKAEIREKYGGEFIAVIDGEVAAATEPPEQFGLARRFIDQLEEEHGREAVTEAYITYVPTV